jgi:hypothetical protein
MSPFDTTSRAEKIQLDVFRRMTPERRLEAAIQLAKTSRELLAQGVRKRHPEYGEDQVKLAVIRLTLGENLFVSVYPEAKDVLP